VSYEGLSVSGFAPFERFSPQCDLTPFRVFPVVATGDKAHHRRSVWLLTQLAHPPSQNCAQSIAHLPCPQTRSRHHAPGQGLPPRRRLGGCSAAPSADGLGLAGRDRLPTGRRCERVTWVPAAEQRNARTAPPRMADRQSSLNHARRASELASLRIMIAPPAYMTSTALCSGKFLFEMPAR